MESEDITIVKFKKNTQFRLGYGSGFRAPQAFDTDLHIAFAGGGYQELHFPKFITRELKLTQHPSILISPMNILLAGFTLETFCTRLNRAFYLQPVGEDEFGYLFEKQNGQEQQFKVNAEFRLNYDRKIQLEGGFTLQSNVSMILSNILKGLMDNTICSNT